MTTDDWQERLEGGGAEETETSTTDRPEQQVFRDLSTPDLRDRPLVRHGGDTPVTPDEPETDERVDSRHLSMALLSHMSVLFGVPVFFAPLFRRKHPLSVHHAKTAAIIWLLFYSCLALSTVSIPVFIPLAMLAYVPALVAVYRAVQGRPAGRWGLGNLAERLFPYPDLSNSTDDG